MTKNEIICEQQCADSDARICDIERRPVIVAGMEHDEVDNITEPDAIGQVTQDAGKQQRTGSEHTIVVTRRAEEIVKDGDGGSTGQHNEEPAAKRSAFLQMTKRNA